MWTGSEDVGRTAREEKEEVESISELAAVSGEKTLLAVIFFWLFSVFTRNISSKGA